MTFEEIMLSFGSNLLLGEVTSRSLECSVRWHMSFLRSKLAYEAVLLYSVLV